MTKDLQKALQKHLGSGYTVEREVVGGGMSRVFIAADHRLARSVAIKVLPSALAVTVSVERFEREIMRAAGLQHPHIVPVLSAGGLEELPYFIMPFVYAESLRTRLARGPLPVSETVGILKDVAKALSYAHESGVVHQDLKPDNILLAAGSAVVTDFGVAEALSASRDQGPPGSDTAVGFSTGTAAYMAPEQAAADPVVDPSADLYTLGIIAYEMLAGVPPFHGKTSKALLKAQISDAPGALALRRSDIPVALDALIAQCLEKVPANRPKSASEIVHALESPDYVSEPFAVPPVASRRSRIAVMSAVVLTAAIAFLFFGWSGRSRIEPEARIRAAVPVLEVPAAAPVAKPSVALPVAKPVAMPVAREPAAVPVAKAPVPVATVKASSPLANPAAVSAPKTPGPVPVAHLGRSLAVLPLSSSGSQRDASVAAGATSELTNALSRIPGLRVASQTAVATARGGSHSLSELGATLGVTLLLEGSVQSAGKKLRMSLRVVTVASDSTIWAQRFDGTSDNIFAIQDAAARAVVAALSTRLK